MDNQNEQFIPETVDEQIDLLSRISPYPQQSESTPVDVRLVHNLHNIYAEHAGTRDRVWARLVEHTTNTMYSTPSPIKNMPLERSRVMQQNNVYPKKTNGQRFMLIAAVLFATLLVGSTVWIFTNARHPSSGASPTPAQTDKPTVIATTAATTPIAPTPTTPPSSAVLPTETSCPAPNTARAAVMPAILLGTHPNIFYMYNPGDKIILRRYDVTTGQKTDVITIAAPQPTGGSPAIANARLSTDGQWIVFHGKANGQDAIQMVRVDGKELQTLYCGSVDTISLSPDQKSLVFIKQYGDLLLLDMTSGKLQTELKVPGPQQPIVYEPIQWRDNSSLYVTQALVGVGGGGDVPYPMRDRVGLYLLKDITKDSSQQSTNLQEITLPGGWQGRSCGDFDMNQDQIVTNNCSLIPAVAMKGPSTIKLQHLNGGVSTVYSDPNNAIVNVRFISSTKLLFATENITPTSQGPITATIANAALWEINTDGTGLTRVMPLPINSLAAFADYAYSPQANVSRDGMMFAVFSFDLNSTSLVFGSNGASPTTFATLQNQAGAGVINLIGWSTF